MVRGSITITMPFDPESFKTWAGAASAVLHALKEAIALIPSGHKKDEAERALAEAEKQLKVAEARVASELGFNICMRCWPPEVMLMNDKDVWLCRKCGKPWTSVAAESVPQHHRDLLDL